jgi:hypothetical protein
MNVSKLVINELLVMRHPTEVADQVVKMSDSNGCRLCENDLTRRLPRTCLERKLRRRWQWHR